MQRFAAVIACVFVGCVSPTLRAQSSAPPATQHAFSYCSVIDTAGHKVWASPVFEYEYVPANAGQFSRTEEMATEFHSFVGSMGGAGDKACQVANGGQAELEALRNESRTILTKRFMGMIRAHKWMDVTWTPKPWSPATAAAKPAVVTKYFYCYASDMSPDQRKTVAALVFEMSVDNSDPVAAYTQATAYGKEFTRDVATAYGLAQAYPECYFKDTRAEAEKALHDYRKLFSGFNLKFTDVTWHPTQGSAATPPAVTAPAAPAAEPSAVPAQGTLGIEVGEVSPTLALALGMDRARGALVVKALKGRPAEAAGIKPMDVVLSINQQAVEQFTDLPVMMTSHLTPGAPVSLLLWRERAEHEVRVELSGPAATVAATIAPATDATAVITAAPAAGASKYCHVFMQFVSKPGGVHSKVWENRDSDGSETAMSATLAAFIAHMHQQQPDVWHEFSSRGPQCDMNIGFCYRSAVRHFGGTSQIAGQFCKRTREEAEADWARLTQNSPEMEIVDWPVAS